MEIFLASVFTFSLFVTMYFASEAVKSESKVKRFPWRNFMLTILAIVGLSYSQIKSSEYEYQRGLLHGAIQQLRGETEVTYVVDEDSVVCDTIVRVFGSIMEPYGK